MGSIIGTRCKEKLLTKIKATSLEKILSNYEYNEIDFYHLDTE
tara:strand:- start:240 stop:368 length:129 start_codon:yes stop_codon:yes gene_type:complete